MRWLLVLLLALSVGAADAQIRRPPYPAFHSGLQFFGSAVTYLGPWWDDGSATQGRTASQSLNANTFNGLTWVGNGGATTNVNPIGISASATSTFGAFRGSQGTTPNQTFTYINTPSSNDKWVVRGLALSATTSFGSAPADFLLPATCCVSGSNVWSYVDAEQAALGAGSIIPKFVLANAASTSASTIGSPAPSAGQINTIAGDNLRLSYYPCNSNTCQDMILNGQIVKVGGVVSGLGFALTNYNFGWRGDMPSTPNKYNYIGVCDPATQACVSLVAPSHIVAVDLNGDLTPHFLGTYTQSALGGLTYSLYDGTTGLVISGFSGLTATLDSTSGTPIPGTTATGSVTTTVLTLATMNDQGAFFHIGDVISGTGITAGTYITSLGTALGGIGTYNLSASSSATGSITVTSTPPTQPGTLYRAHGTKILKANIPASFYYKVCRSDITAGQPESCARSPVLFAGYAHMGMGQSIIQQAYSANLDYDVSFGSNKLYDVDGGWTDSGSSGAKTSAYEVRAIPLNTSHTFTTPPGSALFNYMGAWATATSNPNMVFLKGGIGGTTAYQRAQPGSSALLGIENAIDLAGGDVTDGLDSSGTFDAGTSCPGCTTDYSSSLDTFYSDIDTYVGHQFPVTLLLLGTTQGVASGGRPPYDTIRRIQYNKGTAGGFYCYGLGLAEITHATGDAYHSTPQGWAEEWRRGGLSKLNCALGGTTYLRGLYITSATTPTSSTLAVVFSAPNSAGASVNNPGNTTYGPDQGLNFGTITGGGVVTNALGTLNATGTPVCTGTTTVTCTFTFSGTPFASDKAMVTGPRGSDPFNPANDSTIDNSGATNKDYWADGMGALMATYPSTAVFTGTVSGTALTVSAVASGTIAIGQWITYPGTTRSLLITAGSGTAWTILQSLTIATPTVFTAAEPMVAVQTYFNPAGLPDGSQDFITTP